jgi:predicted dienelactone hydrolase
MLAVTMAAALGGGIYLATRTSAGPPEQASPGVTRSPKPTASASQPGAVAAPHPAGSLGDYPVAQRFFTWTEHRGGTLGTRVLLVSVRYPDAASAQVASASAANSYPLIVFAPGYRQCGANYSDLLKQWASAGYVVAAVNFPRTNCHVGSPDESDLVNQPADLAFVIGQLEQLSAHPGGPLAGVISASRVAVAGQSDGGDTVAAMAAASCCRYPGLHAVIVLAGAEWPAFPGAWFKAPTAPMLFVQGTADTINPPAVSLQMYQADKSGTRYYLQLTGADHLTPYEGDSSPEPIVARVTIAFLDHYLAGDGTVRSMRRAGHVAGVSELVSAGQAP